MGRPVLFNASDIPEYSSSSFRCRARTILADWPDAAVVIAKGCPTCTALSYEAHNASSGLVVGQPAATAE